MALPVLTSSYTEAIEKVDHEFVLFAQQTHYGFPHGVYRGQMEITTTGFSKAL